MAKKKQKQAVKEKKQNTEKKGKLKGYTAEISQMRGDVKTFVENFKSDVEKKKKAYQAYASKVSKKKTSAQQ